MFSMSDEELHTIRRAQCANGYAGKGVEGVEDTIDSHLLQLIHLITEKYISDDLELRKMDFAENTAFLTLDIISELAYGAPWECLVNDEDANEWFASLDAAIPYMNAVSSIPWLVYLINIPIIGNLVTPSGKDQKGPGKLLGVARQIIGDRFTQSDPGAQKDMTGSFLRHGLSRDEAVAEGFLQVLAGSDTSATAIRSTMLHVISNAQVYKALQAEIDSFALHSSIISDEDAKTLPYLQAVIREGVRIWPVATGLLPKIVPPEGDTYKGVFLPGGTEIGQDAWAIQRNTEIYGEDSTVFRPERWLQAKGEKLEAMERTIGLNWGYGKYSCVGKTTAMMELNKTYFTLLKKFDFELCYPNKPWHTENFGLWIQHDMFVRVTLRSAE